MQNRTCLTPFKLDPHWAALKPGAGRDNRVREFTSTSVQRLFSSWHTLTVENLVGFQAEEAAPHTSSILFGDFPILKACRIEIVKNTGGWGKATTKTTPVRSVRSSIPKPCPSFFLLFPFFEDAPRSSPAKNLKSSTLPSATTMHGCASGEAPEQSMFRGVVPPQ